MASPGLNSTNSLPIRSVKSPEARSRGETDDLTMSLLKLATMSSKSNDFEVGFCPEEEKSRLNVLRLSVSRARGSVDSEVGDSGSIPVKVTVPELSRRLFSHCLFWVR